MLEKGKKFLNICLSTFLLLSIIFLFSVQNVKAEEETDTINPDEIQMSVDSLLTGISSKGFHPSKETIFPFVLEYHLTPNRTLRAQPSMYVLGF
ncbi:MAG: hypothetical protein ACLS61_11760 [Ruminococcus sp.]